MLKKLILAPFFIIAYALLLYTFSPILKSYDFIFSLSLATLIQLAILASLFCITSLLFVLFATISLDWKIVSPVGLLASFLPMLFLDPAQGLVLAVGSLAAFILAFATLENRLKSYLTFSTSSLLGPSVRSLITFLVLICSFVYFLSSNQIIQKSGFEIPDSLIDTALQFAQPKGEGVEQLDLLKKNPELLKQSGLDPKILDSLSQPQKSPKSSQDVSNNLIKTAVKDQIQGFIKPYMTFIPAVLAILFFFTIQSIASIISLLIYPLLWITFFALEKSGFVKFTEEMRPVKKMAV